MVLLLANALVVGVFQHSGWSIGGRSVGSVGGGPGTPRRGPEGPRRSVGGVRRAGRAGGVRAPLGGSGRSVRRVRLDGPSDHFLLKIFRLNG